MQYRYVLSTLLPLYLAATVVTGCTDNRPSKVQQPEVKLSSTAQYNAAIDELKPLASKTEIETTADFEERAKKHLSHLERKHFLIEIPVSLGRCQKNQITDPPGPRNYIGLNYAADQQEMMVCALDEVFVEVNGAVRRFNVVPTATITSQSTYEAHNAVGMTATIESTDAKLNAFFVGPIFPEKSERYISRALMQMDQQTAKNLYEKGGQVRLRHRARPRASTWLNHRVF